ncbi:type II toxin-antitoxin system RelE/ParE family toxin [Otariodibacter oris]|uniref:Plasmid stabilization system protein ParE n=1 Tax=Otariodibacter oris TaxID=1032623 RepID=A0A420XI41_9PAST|nr:type II toxin-antitoxin system RelE/ParE family toxin [Otariodibacter oris]QGM81002.1 plasmid stabilization protein [Otariodibacter oris]RKR76818.1 plasmid stabilization system protein ParE [Otariodibacter oris]
MAKQVIITQNAQDNINEIIKSVIEFTGHSSSGIKLYRDLYEKFELIGFLPKSGKLRNDNSGLREIFCRGTYRIVYRELDDIIQIITVIHTRKKYPIVN